MLKRYINDKKIHVVAPPGAGKTINVKESINFESDARYIIKFYEIACTVPKQFDKNKTDANIFLKYIQASKKN